MTIHAEQLTKPAKTEKAKAPVPRPAGFVFTLAVLAVLAWVGGVALHRGWGVDVPFIASFLVLAVGLQFTKIVAHEVGHAWQQQAIQTASQKAAAEFIGTATANAVVQQSDLINSTLEDFKGA